MKEIQQHIKQIKKLCSSNDVKTLFAFGSVVRDELQPDSDIDLLIDIEDKDPITYSDKYFNVKFSLEKIFSRKVELLEFRALKNKFLKHEIDRTKQLVYGE